MEFDSFSLFCQAVFQIHSNILLTNKIYMYKRRTNLSPIMREPVSKVSTKLDLNQFTQLMRLDRVTLLQIYKHKMLNYLSRVKGDAD